MKFKLALLGKGKTGGKVLEIFPNALVFDSQHPPTLCEIKKCQVVISFVPGKVFKKYIPLLIESRLPVIIGSTGFQLPKNLNQKLKKNNTLWVKSSNFAIGMLLINPILTTLGNIRKYTSNFSFSLSEHHHAKKLDSPSGTALSWKEWLGQPLKIESVRRGDELGTHHLRLITPYEEISLIHKTLDRRIFAEGALLAAKKSLKSRNKGLIDFKDLFL